MDSTSTITLHTGRTMPVIGLGTWMLTKNTSDIIAEALNMGYSMIDTSGDYGTQAGIAKGIKQSGKERSDFYLVTKIEEHDDAYEATKKNLSELQLEHVDLVLIHRPPETGAGVHLWQGLIRARDEGLTKDIGVSNYSKEAIEDLVDATGEVPVVNQIEWSPFGWSQTMLEFCTSKNIVIQAYSPITRSERLYHSTLTAIADQYDKSPAQVLLRWNLQKGTIPLPKANQLQHLKENLDVFDFEISAEDMDILDSLNEAYSALGFRPAYQY